jgi:hypothetical protein
MATRDVRVDRFGELKSSVEREDALGPICRGNKDH